MFCPSDPSGIKHSRKQNMIFPSLLCSPLSWGEVFYQVIQAVENVKYPEHLTIIYDPQNLDPDTGD